MQIDKAALLLQQASDIVTGNRRKAYGNPEDNFICIGELWTAYLKRRHNFVHTISASDVAVLMSLVKIARLAETTNHSDSWRDLAGYAACGARASDADLEIS